MTDRFHCVVRGGTIVDGSGGPPFQADMAIGDGRILAIGKIPGPGREEIDARGKIVTPGFVDIHTHYDGQATWASRMLPSSAHGVTTVMMGNCGVGFAPCRAEDRDRLIELMEGVEDIPEVVMTEGLPWNWESFPDYLDALEARRFDVDVTTMLPHSALRVYVMGERAANREPATDADNERMRALAGEAMRAGALGFGTSRTLQHFTGAGDPIPSLGAQERELIALAKGMADAGHGIVEVAMDFHDVEKDVAMLRNIVAESGRPLMVAVAQLNSVPDQWREVLDEIGRARRDGLPITAQVTGRPIGMLMGHELSAHPFSFCPSYRALDGLAKDEKIRALRDPELRRAILAEPLGPANEPALERIRGRLRNFDSMFSFGDPPNYGPDGATSLMRRAAAMGITPEELAYDTMLEQGGQGLIYYPSANYSDKTLDVTKYLIEHDNSVVALGDGGAHCGSICDASYTTFLLSYWSRDHQDGPIPLPEVVRLMTSAPAELVGLHDRGRLRPGYRADLNVIDYDRLHLHAPTVAYDLPGGGRRLLQQADGYDVTMLRGEITWRDGAPTDALPGRLVRGPQAVGR